MLCYQFKGQFMDLPLIKSRAIDSSETSWMPHMLAIGPDALKGLRSIA
jgi:hypothetical protein